MMRIALFVVAWILAIAGFSTAIQRDTALFHGGDPADITFP